MMNDVKVGNKEHQMHALPPMDTKPGKTAGIVFDYLGGSVEVCHIDGSYETKKFGSRKRIEKIQNEATVLGLLAVCEQDEFSTSDITAGTGIKSLDVNKAVRQLAESDVYEGLIEVEGGQRITLGKAVERKIRLLKPLRVSSRLYSPRDHSYLSDLHEENKRREEHNQKEAELRAIKSAVKEEITQEEQTVILEIKHATEGLEVPAFTAILEGRDSRIYRTDPGYDPVIVYMAQEDASDERMESRVRDILKVLNHISKLPLDGVLQMIDMKDDIDPTGNTNVSETLSNIKRIITDARKNIKWRDNVIANDLTENVAGTSGKKGSSGIRKKEDFTIVEV